MKWKIEKKKFEKKNSSNRRSQSLGRFPKHLRTPGLCNTISISGLEFIQLISSNYYSKINFRCGNQQRRSATRRTRFVVSQKEKIFRKIQSKSTAVLPKSRQIPGNVLADYNPGVSKHLCFGYWTLPTASLAGLLSRVCKSLFRCIIHLWNGPQDVQSRLSSK